MNSSAPGLSAKNFLIIACLCLFPWFAVQLQLSINGDAAWLITATQRLFAGETMASGFYEVNPPLSILYHAPPVLLAKLIPLPLHYILFLYFTTLIGLSAVALYTIIRKFDFLDTNQIFVVIAAYLAANTIFTTIAIGERDHIVLLGLAPFLAAQLALTWGFTLPRKLLWTVLICGTLAVLIKPHFGLLPTCLLFHRLFVSRNLIQILRSPDFCALALGTISYVAIVWFFFRDFIDVILPDVLTLYITNRDYASALPELFMHTYLFLVFLGIEAFFSPLKGAQKKFLLLLYIAALLCLVPYAVQMKGFYYQLIPAMGFFFCAFGLTLYSYAQTYIKKDRYIGPAIVIVIFALAYINRPPLLTYPTHDDYKKLPLSKELADCDAPCPYFIFHNNIEIMHPTAFYQGQQNASRFPTFWFLPKLVQEQYKLDHGLPAELTQAEIIAFRRKYGDMTAADFRKYKPKRLVIGQYRMTEDPEDLDFAQFLSLSDNFRDEWAHYSKDRRIELNQGLYFSGTALANDYPLVYDIYVRQTP